MAENKPTTPTPTPAPPANVPTQVPAFPSNRLVKDITGGGNKK
jgi:hypothetical protein